MPITFAAVAGLALGVALTANGQVMLADPAAWYGFVPGVPDTGPLNAHFVRDIGSAYMVAGVALAGFALDTRARAAAAAGTAFLVLHALVPGADALAGRSPTGSIRSRSLSPFLRRPRSLFGSLLVPDRLQGDRPCSNGC
jgi:hypothetical protein